MPGRETAPGFSMEAIRYGHAAAGGELRAAWCRAGINAPLYQKLKNHCRFVVIYNSFDFSHAMVVEMPGAIFSQTNPRRHVAPHGCTLPAAYGAS